MSDPLQKPLPPVDAVSQAYWARCAAGELTLQRCDACGHLQHYPRIACTSCQSRALSLVAASGRGTIRSFTVIRRAVSAAFEADVPYVVALIRLEEGPTMMSNVINADVEALEIGQAVEVTFEHRGEGMAIPQFVPAGAEST